MNSFNLLGKEFIFLNPEYLTYLTNFCLPFLGVWVVIFAIKRFRRPPKTIGSSYPLIGTMKFWLKVIMISAITVLALAWPTTKEGLVFERGSADIIFALDNSLSMRALDVSPKENRLSIGKKEIFQLFARQIIKEGDRVSLFNFAKIPNIQSPLTTDLDLITSLLGEIDYSKPLDESYWDTDLNEVLLQIRNALIKQEDFDKAEGITRKKTDAKKVLILFTDGEDQFFVDEKTRAENKTLEEASILELQKLGIKIYCVGIGTKKGFLWTSLLYGYKMGEDYSDDDVKDWGGKRTVLNTETLDFFAEKTGGGVFTIENNTTSASEFLSRVIDSNRELKAVSIKENEKELWPYLIQIALIIVVLAIIFY